MDKKVQANILNLSYILIKTCLVQDFFSFTSLGKLSIAWAIVHLLGEVKGKKMTNL